jgi:hypothetical protein
MKIILASLKPADRGDAVGNLQDALVLLLDKNIIQTAEDERRVLSELVRREQQQSFYGDGTAKGVGMFQERQQLKVTREVDSPTAEAMNRFLKQLGALPSEKDEMMFTVEGRIASPDRAGVGNLRVQIVDKNVGQDIPFAETVTDDRGRYQISFNTSPLLERHKQQPDLQVCVFMGKTLLGASEVRYNATAYELLDVLLPANTAALPSEHEALIGAIAAHYDGKLGDLKESDDRQDITYLANKTGWDARAVALAALADQFSQHRTEPVDGSDAVGIPPAFYYALFRAGLPANPDMLYQADVESIGRIWKQAIEQGVIPQRIGQEIGGAIKTFQKLSAQKLLAGPAVFGVSSLIDMLTSSGLDSTHQQQFAALYASHRADLSAFWNEVTTIFGAEVSNRLQVDGKLGFLTINNAPLMSAIHTIAGANGLSDPLELAQKGYHRAEQWSKLLTADIQIPDEIPGETAPAKRANYAAYLAAQVRLSYPTAAIAEMVKSGELPLIDAADGVSDQVHAFLTEHHGKFEIGVQPIQQYIASSKLTVANDTVTQIRRLQRVYQITPTDDAMIGLLKAHTEAEKLDAAYHIVRYQRKHFVSRFTEALKGETNAAMTYDRSVQVHNAVLNIATSYLTAKNAPLIGVHSPTASLDPEPKVPGAGDVIAYATLEEVFGGMDFCACDHCRSILSPAAYLVDLLLFIDQKPMEAEKKNPQDVLLDRRPDIAHLPLTCENTNTALPYIDVVNETLEYFIANAKQKLSLKEYVGHDTDSAASEDLLASPQSFNDGAREAAYDILRDENFPNPLPFHQPLENLRRYFQKFEVSLPLAMERFRKSDALDGTDPYGWRDILIEELHLSRVEHDLLTKSKSTSTSGGLTLGQVYGLGSADADVAIATLSNARDFTRRVEITYDDLIALLKTRFINPNSDLIPKLERLGVSIATLFELKTKNDEPTDIAFDARLPKGAGAPDPAEYGGDIKGWVKDKNNFARIEGLITLVDPTNSEDLCRFDNLEFRHATPLKDKDDISGRIGEVEFFRLLRFIRLWKKTGWTIEQTDAAICALYKADLTLMIGNDVDSFAELDAGFVTLLPRLGLVVRVLKALNLTVKRDLLPLLAVWSDIGTHGDNALYRKMFLNPAVLKQDGAFADNGYGEFLTDGSKKLLDHNHAEALRAAFNLTGDEFDRIVTALGFKADPDPKTPLTVSNVSKVFRVGWLARRLRLSIREFLLLTKLTNLDPFAAPELTNPAIMQIIALVQALKDRSLKSTAALYLIWNQDLSGKSGPSPAQVSDFARNLRANFARIESEFAVADDPTGEIARARMTLVYGAEATDFFFGLLNDSFAVDASYTHFQSQFGAALASAIQKAAGTRGDPAVPRVAYDDFGKRLTFTGVLSAATRDAIKAAVLDPAVVSEIPATSLAKVQEDFRKALDTLYKANQAAIEPFFARYEDLSKFYTTFVTSIDPPQIKRTTLLANFLPTLVSRRKRQQTLQAMADAAQTDRGFAEALLDAVPVKNGLHAAAHNDQPALNDLVAVETLGLSVQFFDSDTAVDHPHPTVVAAANLAYAAGSANALPPNATVPGNAISGVWSGSIEAPENGLYNLIIEAEAGATATLNFEGKSSPLMPPDGALWRNRDPISLKGGTLYPMVLRVEKVRSTLRVKWESIGQGREVIPARYLYPAIQLAAARDVYLRFVKAAAIAAAMRLSAQETARPVLNGLTWLNELPVAGNVAAPHALFSPLRDLLDYARIKEEIAPGDDRLFTLLADPVNATQHNEGADSLLVSVTRWDMPSLNAVLGHFGGDLAGLSSLDLFRRVYDAFALVRRMGIGASVLIEATTNEPVPRTVRDLQAALRARYDASDWPDVVKPINNEMRSLQRDALVAYILHQMREDSKTEHIDTADKLFEYFLMDVQMEPCLQTSRIRHALSSVQLFIERCLMNLEANVSPESIVAEQWKWMKRYRVWEANRKVFLYPENWLDPELRDDKSPFFKEIESELLQSDITEDSAAAALLNYLSKLEDVAKLEPCAIYRAEGDPSKNIGDVDHVIARTAGAHRKYYYRRKEGGSWTPWEQVKLEIEDNPVMPVVWKGRVLLFWLRILKQAPLEVTPRSSSPKKTSPKSGDNLANMNLTDIRNEAKDNAQNDAKINIQAILCWSEYFNGKWQPTKTSDVGRPADLGKYAVAGDGAFPRSRLELVIAPESDDGPLEINILDGGQAASFLLYNTHSLPVPRQSFGRSITSPVPPRRYLATSAGALSIYYYATTLLSSKSPHSDLFTTLIEGRAVGPKYGLNSWTDPFFFEDARHVFFITTMDKQPLFVKFAGYMVGINASFATQPTIPPLVLLTGPSPHAVPTLWLAPHLFVSDPGLVDPIPVQHFVTEDRYIRQAIGTTGGVMYDNRPIGPSGAILNIPAPR